METLTVFTPTYNRADFLRRGYEALKRQTCQEFQWVIIDDGSTDGTGELVELFQKEAHTFPIRYFWQKHGGLYRGYNRAIVEADTELMVCVDSDDYLPEDAIERIVCFWKKNGSEEYAGMVGLDYTVDGRCIGDYLPEQKSVNLIDLLVGKYRIKNGDRTNVVRTKVYREYAPLWGKEGEHSRNPHDLHLQISKDYEFLVLNEKLKYVDYQPDGMTHALWKQYYDSPNGFAETRKLYLSFDQAPKRFVVRHMIHYVSSCILAGKRVREIRKIKQKGCLLLCWIPGNILAALTVWKGRNGKKEKNQDSVSDQQSDVWRSGKGIGPAGKSYGPGAI